MDSLRRLDEQGVHGNCLTLQRPKSFYFCLHALCSAEMTHSRLKTVRNRYRDKRYVCVHEFPELTACCPTTKLPDFYTLLVTYEPANLLVELKSLKLYLLSFRNRGFLHEELANCILDEFVDRVRPRWVSVELQVNVRGGITTTVLCRWPEESSSEGKRKEPSARDDVAI